MGKFAHYLTLLLLLAASLAAQDNTYQSLVSKSQTLLASKHAPEALTAAQQAIQANPAGWEGYLAAARAFQAQSKNQDAIGMLQMAQALAPMDKRESVSQALADLQKKPPGLLQPLPGRYFTPETLVAEMNSAATEQLAQFYLLGAYDLTQDAGQSCAVRGTTTPAQLEKISSDYLRASPGLQQADRTAAGVAAQAFVAYWPCPFAGRAGVSQQPLPGRYFTPDTLVAEMNDAATKPLAQFYLLGAYDLTQDAGKSCAVRGTTTPAQLEKISSDYLQANPGLLHADRTAAGVAAQAFVAYWPCKK